MDKYKNLSQEVINEHFLQACQDGKLELVKYLVNSPECEINADIFCFDGRGLVRAAAHGKLEIVRYLLTSPELPQHLKINCSQNRALTAAGQQENFEIIKYLLTSPELSEHANILEKDKYDMNVLDWCYFETNPEIIKYLLTSPELNLHSSIESENDKTFKWLCQRGNKEIWNFLVFEYKLEMTPSRKSYLLSQDLPVWDKSHEEILSLFDKRQLNIDLNDQLKIKSNNKISKKI